MQYRNAETKEVIEGFPADLLELEKVEVEYITLKGWMKPIGAARSFYDLPKLCREYVEYVEKFLGVPIKYIGVGKLYPPFYTMSSYLL